MQVEIATIEPCAEDAFCVEVFNGLGRLWATWSGTPPAVGDSRDVELSLDGSFIWGAGIRAVETRDEAIEVGADGSAILHATLEHCAEDGFVGVRLGTSVVMLEAEGDPPPQGVMVRIEATGVTLHDTGI